MKMKLLLAAIFQFFAFLSYGQAPYKQGVVITDFNIANMLNSPAKTGSFNSLKKDITIIDFFGTWCMPCVRALPILDSLQKKYPSRLAVILVSIEKESQLQKFIAARKNFAFPIIIDEGNTITNLFQPPSYPYTVALNNSNQILAITEAAAITDEKITAWLIQKKSDTAITKTINNTETINSITTMPPIHQNSTVELSAAFIYAAKTGNETATIENKLQLLSFDELKNALQSDDEKKAFWINIYNGYTQLLLKKDPNKYNNRNKFFKAKQIGLAGKTFSLDEIEHDILRRSKIKWSLGYLNKLFPGKKAKLLRVHALDYRIHFALNCGAKSCPPIASYDPSAIQSQLNIATRSYLTSEASYNAENNSLALPAIMGWFRHDFKGKKSMLAIAKQYQILPEVKFPRISFKKYNWKLYLNNYKN